MSENTRAEMEAGRTALKGYANKNNAEHEAGRRAVAAHSGKAYEPPSDEPLPENDSEYDE